MIVKITLYALFFFILIRIIISEIRAPKPWYLLAQTMILQSLKTTFSSPKFDHLRTIYLTIDLSSVKFENRITEIQPFSLNTTFRSDMSSQITFTF